MKKIRIIVMSIVALLSAVAFNAAAGATLSVAMGFDALSGAVGGNVISMVVSSFAPEGALRATVFTEIWTGEMVKAFRTAKESVGWYDRIKSYDQYVNNDVIHFVEIGGDPTVLINNTTYPLTIETLQDADKPVSLDRYDTTATPITDDELHACSYDKMASVQERHRDSLNEKIWEKAIHAIAPAEDDDTTPVLVTSGDASSDGTRKKFTSSDLLAAKRACDNMGMPKNDRIMVLCSDHINDLLETEQRFKDHYNINQTDGKITRLYGFDIYEYDGTPYYKVSSLEKLAWGATITATTDRQASVFYYNGRMMKANGSVSFYHSKASEDPLYHRNLVNFRKWNICMPLVAEKATGAIVSAINTVSNS